MQKSPEFDPEMTIEKSAVRDKAVFCSQVRNGTHFVQVRRTRRSTRPLTGFARSQSHTLLSGRPELSLTHRKTAAPKDGRHHSCKFPYQRKIVILWMYAVIEPLPELAPSNWKLMSRSPGAQPSFSAE